MLPGRPGQGCRHADLSLSAHWLFGAPAANLPVEGQLRLAPTRSLAGYDGYSFGRQGDDAAPVNESLAAGVTDATGKYATKITPPDAANRWARAPIRRR